MKKTLFLTVILGGLVTTQARADWNTDKTIYTYDSTAVGESVTLDDIAEDATEGTAYTVQVTARNAALTIDSDISDATISAITDGTDNAQTLTLSVDGTVGSDTLNLTAANSNRNVASSNITITKAENADTAKLTLGTITGSEGGACYTSITIDSGVDVSATKLVNSWGLPALTVNGTLTLTGSDGISLSSNSRPYTYSGTGTITTTALSVSNWGGPYNFTVANLVTTGTISLSAGTTTTFSGTTLSIANQIQNSANLKFIGDSTIDITAAVTAGTITKAAIDDVVRSEDTDGFGKAALAYTLVNGNAAVLNDGVVLTIKNGNTTYSSSSNTFDGNRMFTGEYVDSTIWCVKTADTSTTTLADGTESSQATGIQIASGKTLTVDSATWNLSTIQGAGNVKIAADTTLSGNLASKATGTLTVDANKTLSIGSSTSDSSNISSFTAITLDGGTIWAKFNKSTFQNVTVTAEGGTFSFYDTGSSSTQQTFSGTTTLNGNLTLTNGCKANVNIAKLTGTGNISVTGYTPTGYWSHEGATYSMLLDSAYTGKITADDASVTVNLTSAELPTATFETKKGTMNLTVNNKVTLNDSATIGSGLTSMTLNKGLSVSAGTTTIQGTVNIGGDASSSMVDLSNESRWTGKLNIASGAVFNANNLDVWGNWKNDTELTTVTIASTGVFKNKGLIITGREDGGLITLGHTGERPNWSMFRMDEAVHQLTGVDVYYDANNDANNTINATLTSSTLEVKSGLETTVTLASASSLLGLTAGSNVEVTGAVTVNGTTSVGAGATLTLSNTYTTNSTITLNGTSESTATLALGDSGIINYTGATTCTYGDAEDNLQAEYGNFTLFSGTGKTDTVTAGKVQVNGKAYDNATLSDGTYSYLTGNKRYEVSSATTLAEITSAAATAGVTLSGIYVDAEKTLSGVSSDPGFAITGDATSTVKMSGMDYSTLTFLDDYSGTIEVTTGALVLGATTDKFSSAAGIVLDDGATLSGKSGNSISTNITLKKGSTLENTTGGYTFKNVTLDGDASGVGCTITNLTMKSGTLSDTTQALTIDTATVSGTVGMKKNTGSNREYSATTVNADSGTLTVNAGSDKITIAKLDMNGQSDKHGNVVVSTGTLNLSTNLWMGSSDADGRNAGTLTVNKDAALVLPGGKVVVKGVSDTAASVKRTGDNANSSYGATRSDYTISDASVELTGGADADNAFAMGNTLSNSTVKNVSGYTTIASTGITGVTVAGGNLAITDASASTDLGAVTLSGGTLTLGTFADHSGKGLITSSLTVSGTGSTLNGNLIMTTGTLTFAKGSTLTMGCTVNIGEDVKVVLDAETISALDTASSDYNLLIGGTVDAGSLVGSDNKLYVYSSDDLENATQHYLFVDNGKIYVTPEPATATLSLLALAGLCARRRRR